MSELTIDRPIEGDVRRSSTARIQQQGPTEFLEAIDRVLAQDGVLSVHWSQYTPYFNDGDPCEFTVREVYVRLDDRFLTDEEREELSEDDWEDEYIEDRPGIFAEFSLYSYGDVGEMPKRYLTDAGEPTDSYYRTHHNPEYAEWSQKYYADENKVFTVNGHDTSAIYEALKTLNIDQFEDVCRENFGDHANVTATKDGFKTEFYDHD
jgi:hypothetical protein